MYVSALTSQGNKIWNRKTTRFVSCPRMVVSVVPINVHYYIPNIRICVAVRQCRKQRYNYMGRKKSAIEIQTKEAMKRETWRDGQRDKC